MTLPIGGPLEPSLYL